MRKKLSIAILLLSVPVCVLLGFTVFSDKSYAYLSLVIVVFALTALILSFEKKENSARQLIVIAIMCVLSIVGRLVFAVIPAFKPVTAIIILLSMYFGGEAGFICGAMTALISNFYFGQGPWTPYQMLAWGLVGLFAGLLAPLLRRNLIIACVYGALAGIVFSLIMDIQTAMWYTNVFDFGVYATKIASSLPFTIIYAVSNVIFLLLLARPIGKKIERLKIKYGI